MLRTVSLCLLLAFFWLLNSGYFTGLLLLLGAASIVLVCWLTRRMAVVDSEAPPVEILRRAPRYLGWLVVQIVQANITVARLIGRGDRAISPTLVTLPPPPDSDLARVIFANSITLVPGTVTIDLDDKQLTAHALTRESAAELKNGEMEDRLARVTG